MKLREAFERGKFALTAEVAPPKGTDLSHVMEEVEVFKGRVHGVNVTDLQSSVMKMGSLTVCHLIKDKGVEPVFQVTCRDRNRLALQSDLLNAAALGIENVLCLTGDYTTLGDHPQAKPVFDLDSVQLLQAAVKLQNGEDMAGEKLEGAPKFFLGAVVNPGADPLEPQLIKMEKKIKAGAQFFQTQAVYDPSLFERFMKEASRFKVPVMLGIVMLKSAGMAKYMNENVAGVFVPDSLIAEMKETPKEDRPKKSVEICARLIKEMKDMCQGVHLMPLGWGKHVPAILDAAGL